MPDPSDFAAEIKARLKRSQPISLADYMAAANSHYYGTRDPFGARGDFTTAPEISQMFGELIGIWVADLWMRAGSPYFHLVELGPGRGTLMVDALRTMRGFGCEPASVQLVEASPLLRDRQWSILPTAVHHDDIDTLPTDAPLIIIANEFFDALPIHQYVMTGPGWREHLVTVQADAIALTTGSSDKGDAIPVSLRRQPIGTVVETCPVAATIMGKLGGQIAAQGGAMLAIDYGYEGPLAGNSFQALRANAMVAPFDHPGDCDLTAHVDFTALSDAAADAGAQVIGPVGQGEFLSRLGIDVRLAALVAASPDRDAELTGQRDRLVSADAMGELFRVLAVHAPSWPVPEGFLGPAA